MWTQCTTSTSVLKQREFASRYLHPLIFLQSYVLNQCWHHYQNAKVCILIVWILFGIYNLDVTFLAVKFCTNDPVQLDELRSNSFNFEAMPLFNHALVKSQWEVENYVQSELFTWMHFNYLDGDLRPLFSTLRSLKHNKSEDTMFLVLASGVHNFGAYTQSCDQITGLLILWFLFVLIIS
jgi:hypothetical protein